MNGAEWLAKAYDDDWIATHPGDPIGHGMRPWEDGVEWYRQNKIDRMKRVMEKFANDLGDMHARIVILEFLDREIS